MTKEGYELVETMKQRFGIEPRIDGSLCIYSYYVVDNGLAWSCTNGRVKHRFKKNLSVKPNLIKVALLLLYSFAGASYLGKFTCFKPKRNEVAPADHFLEEQLQ